VTDLFQDLQTALPERYAVERELGRGGAATVYLVRDLQVGRLVALKVLRPEVASVVGTERFLREIQLAAQLQHSHILPLFDSGEIAGRPYYTMPYVGESLRARLFREPQLPLNDALRIAGEVADALAYAHSQGVIHRDIKPENILLESGPTGTRALVADFGIAQALTVAAGERLTETGVVIGTPTYMSPEQAAGSNRLDARSDLYSLGCVLYEMLAGAPPFTGPTVQAVLARHAVDPVPSLRTVRPTVPEGIERAVTTVLAKVPADRYATATELIQALTTGERVPRSPVHRRRIPVAVMTLGLGVALGLGVLFAWRRSHGPAEATPKRLAVLPFENLGDPADAYFADGVTDAVRGKLTALPELRVIATTSSNQYRRTPKPPRQIGQELGVDYLLVGKVRWVKAASGGSRVQVSPELVEVGSATARWQQPFDAALTDVFQVQADIAGQVAQALGVALGGRARAALAARPTQNLKAYDAFLRGDRLLVAEGRKDAEASREAVAGYREAVRLDSSFGLAWARLAWAEMLNPGANRADSNAQAAHRAADRALALAPERAESWVAIAIVRANADNDVPGAVSALERARTLAPHEVDALSLLGLLLFHVGRGDEGVARAAEAARLDPRSPLVARRYAMVLRFSRRYATADSVATAALQVAPDNTLLLDHAVAARLAGGDVAGARAILHSALAHIPARRLVIELSGWVWLMDDSVRILARRLPPEAFAPWTWSGDRGLGLVTVALIHWNEGRYAAARAAANSARPLLEKEVEQRPSDGWPLSNLAITHAYLGRCADAVREAERVRALDRVTPNTPGWSDLAGLRMDIGVRCGDYASAVAWADTLIHVGWGATAASLGVNPGNAPLRGRPDFERLVAGK
jgi:TolB-like protein/Flp pilus assembly protein TadD